MSRRVQINVTLSPELIDKITESARACGCSVSYAFECLARAGAGLPQVPVPVHGRPGRSTALPQERPAKLGRMYLAKRYRVTLEWARRSRGLESAQHVIDE